jgi:hypothetical protein
MRATAVDSVIRNRGRLLRRALLRLASLAIGVACVAAAPAQAPRPDGDGADAYLLGFIQYVRWPAEESIAAWQVCRPGAAGKAVPSGERTARGKPVTVRPVAAGDSLDGCQILDLTRAPAASARAMLALARKQPILTVGEDAAFCTAGGVVCLRPPEGANGFEINLSAVQEAGLRVNAQLLSMGRKRQATKEGQ